MYIKKIFIYISCIIILTSCGGGGGSNNIIDDKPAQLIINSSSFPSGIYSYDPAELIISSNYPSCTFNVTSSYIYWMTSSDNVFSFNAPITFLENESFPINISSISSESCPAGQKNIEITVNRLNTKYIAVPSNISDLSTDFYNIVDIGFGGISLSETYSATICYPTPEDCITYVDQVFGQDAHNMQTGDFNGDGFEDLAVVWAIFPHTIEEDQKIPAPIHIYLNDGKGHLYEDMSIFANEEYPTHPFAYRTVIRDFNSDGIDDIFAGSMGKSVR